jgi:hypothetical protein
MVAIITQYGRDSLLSTMAAYAAVLEPMGALNLRYIATRLGSPNSWQTLVNMLTHMSFLEILENETKVTSLMLHASDVGACFSITHRDWTPRKRNLRQDEPDYSALYDIQLCEEP